MVCHGCFWVHPVSLDTFGVAVFTRVMTGGRWVHPVSLGSLGGALGVVEFIRGRWIHWSSSLNSSVVLGFTQVRSGYNRESFTLVLPGESSVVVGFTRVRPGGRWVMVGLTRVVFGVVLFMWGRCLGVVGIILGRWVHSGSHWVTLDLSGVVGFTRVRLGGCWVHPGSLCSLEFALVFVDLEVVGCFCGRSHY